MKKDTGNLKRKRHSSVFQKGFKISIKYFSCEVQPFFSKLIARINSLFDSQLLFKEVNIPRSSEQKFIFFGLN